MPNTERSIEQRNISRVNIEVKIGANDLPLCCPMPSMTLWDMHPRVFLAIDEDSQAICPYCGTCYVLVDD